MYHDIVWKAKGNKEHFEHNSLAVAENARSFPRGHWSFLGPGSEEKWYGTHPCGPDGSWDRRVEQMLAVFSRSGHPIFRASSAFARRESRSKRGRKKSTHFSGSTETIELLLRTVISANQLSIYGAVADLCDEVPKRARALGKSAAPMYLKKVEIPAVLSKAANSINAQQQGKPSARIRVKI